MNLEQAYFRNRMRRHNRLLHGWGVVCGAEVCPVPNANASADDEWRARDEASSSGSGRVSGSGSRSSHHECSPCDGWDPWKVVVTPGYILGPYGDEIIISSPVIVDLRQRCTPEVSGDCWSQAPDPWCSDVKLSRVESPLFVALRYKEIMTRPVRVPPPGCGCDDLECEYSRWCDGYEICMLSECPDSHRRRPVEEPEFLPQCPPCPDEPWIVFAEVEFDSETGCVERIDNCSCRRIVHSYACYWWRCGDKAKVIERRETGEVVEIGEAEPEESEREIRHLKGGWYAVEGFGRRVRNRKNAREVARALDEGKDPLLVVDPKSIAQP